MLHYRDLNIYSLMQDLQIMLNRYYALVVLGLPDGVKKLPPPALGDKVDCWQCGSTTYEYTPQVTTCWRCGSLLTSMPLVLLKTPGFGGVFERLIMPQGLSMLESEVPPENYIVIPQETGLRLQAALNDPPTFEKLVAEVHEGKLATFLGLPAPQVKRLESAQYEGNDSSD